MALVTKMIRCAVCGSSDVSFDGKTYHCATCGTDSDVSMPAADIAAVNRIVAMGNDAEAELPVCAAVPQPGYFQLGQGEPAADQINCIFSYFSFPCG